jgi:hypothetical protein
MKDQNDHHPEVEYFSEGCRWFGADYEPKAARANLIVQETLRSGTARFVASF